MKALFATRVVLAAVVVGAILSSNGIASPAGFIENRGQQPEDVLFYAHRPDVSIWLTPHGCWIDLHQPKMRDAETGRLPENVTSCAVRFDLPAALRPEAVEGEGLRTGLLNFYGGARGPAEGVRVFDRVRYGEVWPGVDLSFRLEEDALVYELHPRAGGSAPLQVFDVVGATEVEVQGEGAQEIRTPLGSILDLRSGGAALSGRLRFPAEIQAGRTAADKERDLPGTLVWSTFFGGSGYEDVMDVEVLPPGQVVGVLLTGRTASADFPATTGVEDTSYNGGEDAFVALLSPDGSTVTWATYLGGSSNDIGYTVYRDGDLTCLVGGGTESTDFPTSLLAYDNTHSGASDGFLAQLKTTEGLLRWSTYLGGSDIDAVSDVIKDASAGLLVALGTKSSNFPTTAGAFDQVHNGLGDGAIACLSTNGRTLLWSTFLGGPGNDNCVALRSTGGEIVVAGSAGNGFPVTSGAFDPSFNGGTVDGYVARLTSSGSNLVWSTYLGGQPQALNTGEEAVLDLEVGAGGEIVVAGRTNSADFPTTVGAFDRTYGGLDLLDADGFVSRLSGDGAALLQSSYLGGSDREAINAVEIGSDGSVYCGGFTGSADFPVTFTAFDGSANGQEDVAVSVFSPDLSGLVWSTFLGGTGTDVLYGVDLDEAGQIVVAGTSFSTGFPATAGAFDTISDGDEGYVARFDLSATTGVDPGADARATEAPIELRVTNPARQHAEIRWSRNDPRAVVSIAVYDLLGRELFARTVAPEEGREQKVSWNLTGKSGRPVPAGVYHVRLRAGDRTVVGKFTIIG